LLWIASDGNQDLQPDTVWHLVTRILRKTQGVSAGIKHPQFCRFCRSSTWAGTR
jgi:hypothetical protein